MAADVKLQIIEAIEKLGGFASSYEISLELNTYDSVDRERLRNRIISLTSSSRIDKIPYSEAVQMAARDIKVGNRGVVRWAYKLNY